MRAALTYLRTASAALRMLIAFTVVLGVAYPMLIAGIGQIPGLRNAADGSLVKHNGTVVGSRLIGQNFTDADGDPFPQYFQPRPSAGGYDPTASGASNLGPESIIDTLANPADPSDIGTPSLLSQVCSRSLAVGRFNGVDGSRPYCTSDGVGAVLAVFWSGPGYRGHVTRVVSVNQACPATPVQATYHGVTVRCATYGQDYTAGQIMPIRGNAPAHPAVPPDAVTASGSCLDPNISPAYASLQQTRIAKARHISTAQVAALVARHEQGRDLGFLGEPRINVLQLNHALDLRYPHR